MASADRCDDCGLEVPSSNDRCPHCGRPSRFPNVIAAEKPDEIVVLEQRYKEALSLVDPSVVPVLKTFETAVAQDSQAVIARYSTEVYALAANERVLYASFYQLIGAGARLPSEGFWDTARAKVDEVLFTNYKENIRFAALSLDGQGLSHYGDCYLVLKEEMIAHRATVFDENTVVFMHRLQIPVTAELPAGHRAPWRERGRLAIAKLVNNITFSTTKADFPLLLLSDGLEPEDDQFVEVHIYGPISIRSIEKVSLKTRGSAVRRKALREKLSKLGIPLKAH